MQRAEQPDLCGLQRRSHSGQFTAADPAHDRKEESAGVYCEVDERVRLVSLDQSLLGSVCAGEERMILYGIRHNIATVAVGLDYVVLRLMRVSLTKIATFWIA